MAKKSGMDLVFDRSRPHDVGNVLGEIIFEWKIYYVPGINWIHGQI